ncbi:hypothetical protein ONZ51_g412 [Trametes cubensis]|uniref:F-box domain-containing protein n=1 Tax=Trametes cubensis TaxID=1111947 RepID=A0AAD7U3E4_9APHY|nr:hypothetical protein ONZ51_g412 [Trametes cubensis]
MEDVLMSAIPGMTDSSVKRLSGAEWKVDDLPWETIQRRHALAASARVCRAWSEHALDVLWGALDNMHPLLRVFSSYEDEPEGVVLRRNITNAEWARFRRYAHCVRDFRWETDMTIPSYVWILLAQRSNGLPLLPNLRTLEARSMRPSDFARLLLLLPQTLCEVAISFSDIYIPPDPSDQAAIILEAIVPSFPHLKKLELVRYFPLAQQLLYPLLQCPKLESLALPRDVPVDLSFLRGLAQMGTLKSLSVAVDLGHSPDELDLTFLQAFRELEELCLAGHDLDLSTMIAAIKPTALRHFGITFNDALASEAIGQALRIIHTHLPLTITKYEIAVVDLRGPDPRMSDILEPALLLTKLTHLSCDLGELVVHLSDYDLTRMARTWSDMRCLKLVSDEPQRRQHFGLAYRPTFRALLEFAQCCPDLHTLYLPCLDVSNLPMMYDIPVLDHPLHNVSFVNLYGTVTSAFAILLDRIFPHFEELDVFASGDTDNLSRLREYVRLMKVANDHRIERYSGRPAPRHKLSAMYMPMFV